MSRIPGSWANMSQVLGVLNKPNERELEIIETFNHPEIVAYHYAIKNDKTCAWIYARATEPHSWAWWKAKWCERCHIEPCWGGEEAAVEYLNNMKHI